MRNCRVEDRQHLVVLLALAIEHLVRDIDDLEHDSLLVLVHEAPYLNLDKRLAWFLVVLQEFVNNGLTFDLEYFLIG